jgi:ADP-heptose:LPS heptosyltransferase
VASIRRSLVTAGTAILQVLRAGRALALWLFDSIALTGVKCSGTQTTRVGLVRLDAIGDFVLWTAAAASLRHSYDQNHITLIAPLGHAELARMLPFWDEVVALDTSRFVSDYLYRWRTLRSLRRRDFGIVIHPTQSRTFLTGDAVVRASGAHVRIGAVGDLINMPPWQKRISDRFYTRLIESGNEQVMELVRNAAFVSGLTGRMLAPATPTLPIPSPPNSLFPSDLSGGYFVLFPGASWSGRQWPPQKFAQVADHLRMSTGWVPVLCGGKNDAQTCASVARLIEGKFVSLAGRTSLVELCGVIKDARIVITNETSVAHIGPAVGTPTVCVLGGGHFGKFAPYSTEVGGRHPVAVFERMPCYGCNWRCTLPHREGEAVSCISRVDVISVVEAAISLIKSVVPPRSMRP